MEKPVGQELALGRRTKIHLLSAAHALHKKIRGESAPLRPDAESLHPFSQDYNWNESFYFNFMDPRNRIGGWTRIGILPNQETDIGAMMLYAGGSRILATFQGGRTAAEGKKFSLGDLDYLRLEPLKKWQLVYSGDMFDIDDSRKLPELNLETLKLQNVEVDLVFEGVAPCFNFMNANSRALAEMIVGAGTRLKDLRDVSKISSHHYEQAGRINGTIKIGNREISFSGGGIRDHSWGPRDWAAPRLWRWLSCHFDEELSFNLTRIAITSVDVFNGFLTRDGVNYPLRRAALESELEEDGVTQKSLRFWFEDVGGEIIEVNGEVLTVIPILLESEGHRTLVNEALTEYRCGDKVGYGISEYLHQLGSEA